MLHQWGLVHQEHLIKCALHVANRLGGNPPSLAALEITQGGLILKAQQDCVIALSGADCNDQQNKRPEI